MAAEPYRRSKRPVDPDTNRQTQKSARRQPHRVNAMRRPRHNGLQVVRLSVGTHGTAAQAEKVNVIEGTADPAGVASLDGARPTRTQAPEPTA